MYAIRSYYDLFLARQAERKRKRFSSIDRKAMDILLRHPWTGNVRELV